MAQVKIDRFVGIPTQKFKTHINGGFNSNFQPIPHTNAYDFDFLSFI